MPTSHTEVTIANLALDTIAEFPMTVWEDNTVYGRWIRRNFTHTVRMTLRQNPWNFACGYFTLNASPTAPAYRWTKAWYLPNGWIRVLPLTENGLRGGRQLAHEVKGNMLLTNHLEHARVEIVMDIQNPGEWDDLFAQVIAARLALGMAHRFTGKTSYVDRAKEMAQEAYGYAEETNAFEGSLDPVDQHDIIRARYDDNDGYGLSLTRRY